MLDYLYLILSSAWTQVIIFFLLLAYFFTQRKDPRLVVSGLSLLRTVFLVTLMVYFVWNWSTEIPPSLRQASVLGMFIINLFLIKNLTLITWERPYRNLLEAYGREPEKFESLDQIWRSGKRLYYARYFLSALFSGSSPPRVLHGIATQRIRQDIQETLLQYGKAKKLISFQTLVSFLKKRLAQDEVLPPELKEIMDQSITNFAQHKWIEEQINDFLTTVVEAPENMHQPEWTRMWEKVQKSS